MTTNASSSALSPPRTRTRSLPTVPIVVASASVVCLLISLLGVTWLHIPANPVAKTPGVDASRGDLASDFDKITTTWVQGNYFSWMVWVLSAVILVAAVAVAVTGRRAASLLLAAIGLVGLILTTYGFKGELTFSQYWDARSNLRIGGYLAFVGFLLAFVAGLLPARTRD